MMSSMKTTKYPLLLQLIVVFIDFLWIISFYVIISFSLAVLIDGYILPPFMEIEATYSSMYLAGLVLLQLAVQGFIAIILFILVLNLPSPVEGIFGYNSRGYLGTIIKNPAIISVILLTLSYSLRERLLHLFSRFDSNGINK